MTNIWRKIENENGFPFYFNDQTNMKQWDHPKFSDLRQRIDDCNYIKYSTYRFALKFRVLQHALHMEDVQLSIIAGVFDRHRLGANESSLCLESCDLEAVLSDIFFAANKKNHTNNDVDFATELMLNFLYNVYDEDRKGKIQVASTKIVLASLSSCSLPELHRFIFELCADHNNCVTRLRLQSFLTKLVEVANFLHEDASFGHQLVNPSVDNCFSNSPGLVGISESVFVNWLENGPQLLAWLPLLNRIKLAETVVHFVKCTTCKTNPIMGLRYKCMKCSRYTQCQRCFFTGRTSHKHKLSHSMREYSVEGGSTDCSYAFIKKMCRFLPCAPHLQDSHVSVPFRIDHDQDQNLLCSNIEPLSTPHAQLQIIIRQLEAQNRELQQILTNGKQSDKEIKRYLEDHRIHVGAQIQKLKILKDYIKTPPNLSPSPPRVQKNVMQSTPMVANGRLQRNAAIDLFSPIIQEADSIHSEPEQTTLPYNIEDMTTWLGGPPKAFTENSIMALPSRKSPVREFHNDLDDALAKLQQILANNFSLDESLGPMVDNSNLKNAVCEVEGMLTSIVDSVEHSRSNSVKNRKFEP